MEYTNFTFPKGWTKKLDNMTEWNDHTGRLIEIAKECEKQAGAGSYNQSIFGSIRKALEDNRREHDRAGYLTENLYTIRWGLTLYLQQQIGFTFGPEVLAKIRP